MISLKDSFRGYIREISDSAQVTQRRWHCAECYIGLFQYSPTFFVSFLKGLANQTISNLKIKYLRENEQVRETVFVCSYGVQVEPFKTLIYSDVGLYDTHSLNGFFS